MKTETMLILELFGAEDDALDIISERIFHGDYYGRFGIVINRDDIIGEITEEMEKYFDGENEYEIMIDWDLHIE